MTYYLINEQYNSIEIYFDAIPDLEIRNELKANGFRWHKMKRCWYATRNSERMILTLALLQMGNNVQIENNMKKVDLKNTEEPKIEEEEKTKEKKESKIIVETKIQTVDTGVRQRNNGIQDYEITDNIVSLIRSENTTLQLNKISWSGGKPVYDLREWHYDKMKKGISFSEDELREILYAIEQTKKHNEDNINDNICRCNEIAFENEYFKIKYLGYRESSYSYLFDFEVENISEEIIGVDIEKLYICDCEMCSHDNIVYDLKPHKRKVDYVSILKKEMRKQWIKKIWEHSSISIELSFAHRRKNSTKDFEWDDYTIVATVNLAPDKSTRKLD